MKILLLGKSGHQGVAAAQSYLQTHHDVDYAFGNWRDALPKRIRRWRGELIVSYLAPWVVPEEIIEQATFAAINFHPGPPNYPGIGCTNFALYNEEVEYGVTCHHMAPQVDSGDLVATRNFSIESSETVHSLTQKCHSTIWKLFVEVFENLTTNGTLPRHPQTWTRKPYRRRELNDLCRIDLDMPASEIIRRVRATAYPGAPGAYVEIGGLRFSYDGDPLIPIPAK